jgi:hypothetical protein
MRTRPGEQVAFRNHPDVLWIEKETQRIAIAKLRFRLKSISIFVGLDKALAGTSRTQLTFALCTFRKPTDICPRCPDLTESGRDEQHRN